jgi:hypothetical protein
MKNNINNNNKITIVLVTVVVLALTKSNKSLTVLSRISVLEAPLILKVTLQTSSRNYTNSEDQSL